MISYSHTFGQVKSDNSTRAVYRKLLVAFHEKVADGLMQTSMTVAVVGRDMYSCVLHVSVVSDFLGDLLAHDWWRCHFVELIRLQNVRNAAAALEGKKHRVVGVGRVTERCRPLGRSP